MVGSDLVVSTLVALSSVASVDTIMDTDNPVDVCYQCVNTGNTALKITKVGVSCGCTVANYPKGAVMPGDTATITLRYNPHNQIGDVDVQAFVYSSPENANPPQVKEPLVLLLSGFVKEADRYSHYKVAMGALRLRVSTVTYSGNGRRVERIACANTSDKPLKIKAMLSPEGVSVRTEPESIPPHGEADIVITIDSKPRLMPAKIILDGLQCPPSQRTITIK